MSGKVRLILGALFTLLALQGGGRGARVSAQDPDSASTVQGRVMDHETGGPLAGASISLIARLGGTPGLGVQTTGEEGGFFFEDISPGLYRLRVTLLGYHEFQDTLRVRPRSDLDLTLPLSVEPVRLEPIVVISRRQPPGPMMGFEMRRQRAAGYFLTREDIEASAAYEFTDLLRRIPGIRLVPDPPYKHWVFFRGGCTPDLWVDGTLAGTTPDFDSFLRPEQVEAVEVYQGADLPIEFGSNLCGAIVVWTRIGREETGAGEETSRRQQFLVAGVFVLVSVLTFLLRG